MEKRCCGRKGNVHHWFLYKPELGGWKLSNDRTHPLILQPQNRCLPYPLAAPFPRQPEPRCNTLDFASKVVCQRDAAAPLETQEKRPSTALLVLGQCADPLAHSLEQWNDKRISYGEIAHSFWHPGLYGKRMKCTIVVRDLRFISKTGKIQTTSV